MKTTVDGAWHVRHKSVHVFILYRECLYNLFNLQLLLIKSRQIRMPDNYEMKNIINGK